MYVQGTDRAAVQRWVDTVHDLRYKDYRLVAPVRPVPESQEKLQEHGIRMGSLDEVDTVKGMAAVMEANGLLKWWRTAMGFARE
jgi:hypothetical protein